MIICVGEILADLIGREHDGIFSYDRFAGGAPFNVACGLKKLGAACGFYGSVGDDLVGDFLISFAERQNFDFLETGRTTNATPRLLLWNWTRAGSAAFPFTEKTPPIIYCSPRRRKRSRKSRISCISAPCPSRRRRAALLPTNRSYAPARMVKK